MKPLLELSPAQFAELTQRLHRLADGAPSGALLSVSIDLGEADAGHDWLDHQPKSAEFCYWARPGETRYRLGIGRAVACTSAGPARLTALQAAHAGIVRHWLHDAGGTAFRPVACLGFAFADDTAEPLPNAHLGVAALVLDNDRGRLTASFTTPTREAASAPVRWQALLAGDGSAPARPLAGTLPDETLARQRWRQRVEAALAAIGGGEFEKVVLSRTLRLALVQPGAPVALLRHLALHHPDATIYAFGNGRGVFLGATPETLASLAGRQVRVDALAGTAWNGQALDLDKNRREQGLVVDAVRDALSPLCSSLDVPNEAVELRLRDVSHLLTPIRGIVHAETGLFDLIAALHPTPAVGGWPAAPAGEWLRRNGERRPGWYGGGIGWIDREGNGDVAVALRCGLIAGGSIEIPAGAGIVAGSLADHEFDETTAKLRTMRSALGSERAEWPMTGSR